MSIKTWTLINYFDVWGNKKEGFEINNQCIEFDDLYIDDTSTKKEIIKYLKSINFLSKHADLRTIIIEDHGDRYELYERKTQRPICCLELNY